MQILGILGSPRKKGNTIFLLNSFMDNAKEFGFDCKIIDVYKKNIKPCIECGLCEKKGVCSINDDDMTNEIYHLIRNADIIVIATPIFFYSAPSQIKALIDRCQMFWSRIYRLKLNDPRTKSQQGFLMSVGATKGKNLFEGLILTTKYLFDATGTNFFGSLTYRRIENKGDICKHETAIQDVKNKVSELVNPIIKKTKIIFACIGNSCRSQIAAAFAQEMASDKLYVTSAGSRPASSISSNMVSAMEELGYDMSYRKPQLLSDSIAKDKPDIIVTMGCGEDCPYVPNAKIINWDIPDPIGKPIEDMRDIRDMIKTKVKGLIESL